MKWIKWLIILFVVLGVVGAAGAWYLGQTKAAAVQFRTATVARGDVISTISATGTVEPDEVIDVGSQVTGQILKFGDDANGKRVDYGSHVQAGHLLALIDDSTYAASVTEAKAQLEQAKAGVNKAMADVETAQAKFSQADSDWTRAQKIGSSDALAQTTYDNYKSMFEQAKAAVSVAQAALESAKATVNQTASAVNRAQKNLDFCTINCPVDGVIIDRRVNVGQTVVSAMSVSSMFLIAKDLKQMQVWVAVNEADIGSIHVGQPVTFTCDAFGDHAFKGTVSKIRYNAQMTQNVVIYTIEVSTDNSDGKLLPYLTANVQFEVERVSDVMTVPNAALRWMPTTDQIAPDARNDAAATSGGQGDHRGGGGGKGGGGKTAKADHKPGTLWVKDGDYVRAVPVTVGVTDGAVTAVTGDKLSENTEVVVGVTVAAAAGDSGTTNPFVPQMRRR